MHTKVLRARTTCAHIGIETMNEWAWKNSTLLLVVRLFVRTWMLGKNVVERKSNTWLFKWWKIHIDDAEWEREREKVWWKGVSERMRENINIYAELLNSLDARTHICTAILCANITEIKIALINNYNILREHTSCAHFVLACCWIVRGLHIIQTQLTTVPGSWLKRA